jgi:hypothetical protein
MKAIKKTGELFWFRPFSSIPFATSIKPKGRCAASDARRIHKPFAK